MESFDYEGRKAYVRRVDCDYFTDAIDYTQVKELEEFESADVNGARAAHGDVRVNTQIVGFKKIKFYTHGERRRGQSLHAGAGDAHDRVLAASSRELSGALSGPDAHREAERADGTGAACCAPWRRCC